MLCSRADVRLGGIWVASLEERFGRARAFEDPRGGTRGSRLEAAARAAPRPRGGGLAARGHAAPDPRARGGEPLLPRGARALVGGRGVTGPRGRGLALRPRREHGDRAVPGGREDPRPPGRGSPLPAGHQDGRGRRSCDRLRGRSDREVAGVRRRRPRGARPHEWGEPSRHPLPSSPTGNYHLHRKARKTYP